MTAAWYRDQKAMAKAEVTMDYFHKLLIENKLKDAQEYIELPSVKEAIESYYGKSTYQTLLDEMEEALILPF